MADPVSEPKFEPLILTDARMLPGADKVPDFMLHAIQQIIDGRSETREIMVYAARLLGGIDGYQKEMMGPEGVLVKLRGELVSIRQQNDLRHKSEREALDAIRASLDRFGERLTSIETTGRTFQEQMQREVTALRSDLGKLERRVDKLEESFAAGDLSVPRS